LGGGYDILNVREKIDDINSNKSLPVKKHKIENVAVENNEIEKHKNYGLVFVKYNINIFLFDFGVDTSFNFWGVGLTLPTVDGVFITFCFKEVFRVKAESGAGSNSIS
jgi:hypothetical protein